MQHPFEDRLKKEKQELHTKLTKLRSFFNTITYKRLDYYSRELLIKQAGAMNNYLMILMERIDLLKEGK